MTTKHPGAAQVLTEKTERKKGVLNCGACLLEKLEIVPVSQCKNPKHKPAK